ncbi:MAG: hypothetical protein ACLUGG_04880 [Oscillospiraceae bacterium]|nr:hypothetical protein [Christensenellales bacterium]HIR68658.1 hypothetical protein [Candidatus Pelethousia gallinarum]
MTKKMIFGLLLTLVGMAFSLFCFIQAATHPWDYNGIDGLWGSFLGTGMLFPFILAMAVMCGGLVICYLEAYPKNK